ncbi:MAG TPA: hypothetical protein H9787_11750 [Candidatus Oscillibacter excrementigallinarum]|uniref:Uncharacterized protein n=1 Tax=Candidatus Oscillibacter excrementigallinarum TaxID=2838716 RepID=A0A9D2LKT6_9FIRM|nr:hypothetical protein [Candidatus Oscillibacter excrementigallinarum]
MKEFTSIPENPDMEELKSRLDRIESLLQRLPEIQAAVFLQMQEELEDAHRRGLKSSDIWVICPPESR